MLLLPLLPAALIHAALGADTAVAPPKAADYKRADTNFYAKGDVLKTNPTAAILAPTSFAQNGDTYTFTPKKKAPKTVYLEAPSDWIEPITPPEMPTSLDIPPDAMQIREPQGDVQVAMPSAPANFAPVTDGMSLPNGAVVKTGTNATAAVLFGGVDSARLMPDSEAAVQQSVAPQSRAAEVDLTAGGVFSKVGTQVGVKGEFQVHTPNGNAIAQGGDFVAITTSGRTDVWVAQGTVELLQPDGKKFGTVTADGTGPLKLIRFPAIADPQQSLQADADTLTSIMNFIPVANQKLTALHAKQAKGSPLTANEESYLHRIKQIPAVIKLALVEPPAPPPPPPVPAPAPVPPVAAVPTPPEPVTIVVHPNGTIKFQKATTGLAEFQAKLKALIAAQPTQAVIIKASPLVPYDKFEAVVDSCKDAQVKEIAVAPPAPKPPEPAPVPEPAPATPAVAVAPAPPATPATPVNPDVAVIPAKPAVPLKPLPVTVHEDGTVGFQGKKNTLVEFQEKVKAMVKATPDREIVIKAGPKVAYDKIKAVLDACADAQVSHVTAPPPPPAPAPPPVTAETPAAPAMPVAAETPPAPPVVNDKPIPAEIDLAADGSLMMDGTPVTEDELKSKLADLAKTNPKNPLVMMKQPQVTKAQWQHIVSLAHAEKLKLLVKDGKAPVVAAAPPTPRPAAAEGSPIIETPPAPPAPPVVNDKPVPAEIDLAADGSLMMDGTPVTEDELKSKLADLAKTHPKNPLVMMKPPKIAKEKWQHIVALCHEQKLKLLVKDTKAPAVVAAPPATNAPAAMPPTAETPAVTPAAPAILAPHLAATPMTSPAPEETVPVEIEVTSDGQISFLGEPVSDAELQSRLDGVAKANPNEPVLIVKDEKVTHDQWEKVVTICHAAKLKVHVKTVKSSDSTFVKPGAHPPGIPAPHLAASPAPEKILPVEIGIATDGRMTFEGAKVTEDDLKTKLATIGIANPNQPVVLVKKGDVASDQVQNVLALCHASNLKVTVKSVKAFTPVPPATASSPTENLPEPSVHMHPSLNSLSADAPATPATASPTNPAPIAGP